MLSTAKIKFINALKQKKFRIEHKLFIAEGVKVVNDLIAHKFDIKEIYATENYINTLQNLSVNDTVETIQISDKELNRISALTTPNQVLAVCRINENFLNKKELYNSWTFVLDGINDPGNLGTIIRIAHWFNIKHIICAPDTVDVYNPKTVQATMGSLAYVNIFYTDLLPFLSEIKSEIPIMGTFMNGKNIHTVELPKQGIVVFGSESHGISKEIETLVKTKISIPSASSTSRPDSLNVAVSAGIVASELQRKNLLI